MNTIKNWLINFVDWLKVLFNGFCHWLVGVWNRLKPVLLLLFDCRWSVIVLLLGAGTLLSSQGSEIAVRTGDSWGYALFAALGTFLWALHGWFDTRRVLDHLYNKSNESEWIERVPREWIERVPRLIGSGSYFVAAFAFFQAWRKLGLTLSNGLIWLIVLNLALAVVFYRLLEARHDWPSFQKKCPSSLQSVVGRLKFEELDWLVDKINPFTLLYSTGLFLLATVEPVRLGFTVGSVGILFLALSSILAAGSWLSLKMMKVDPKYLLIRQKWVKVVSLVMMLLAFLYQGALTLAFVLVVLVLLRALWGYAWFKSLLCKLLGLWSKFLKILMWLLEKLQVWRPTPPAESKAAASAPTAERYPVITTLLILALVFSSTGLNDNHGIPTQPKSGERPELNAYTQAWLKQAPQDRQGKKPMVIVATAGGGIRAAYWTAAVLGGITDAKPDFRNSLYGLSGVSGGSVGLAVYSAMLHAEGSRCASAQQAHCLRDPALEVLSEEFLAPVLARMLYPDLMQRFLPLPALPDRAASLEAAWQASWRMREGGADLGLDAPLSSRVGETAQGWQPALFLNSTHVETGQRVVASSVNLYSKPEYYLDAVDLTGLLGRDVRLGTAALNSARFTYVSPPGTLPCADQWPFCHNGHVVDGGYFENFGAVTASQTLRAALRNLNEDSKNVRPIVILISNDKALANTIEDDNPPKSLPSTWFAMESLGPVYALLQVRESRGILAAKDLRAKVKEGAEVEENNFFHFRMDLSKGQPEPALGWVLSVQSQDLMSKLLVCSKDNLDEFTRLLEALGSDKATVDAVKQQAAGCKT